MRPVGRPYEVCVCYLLRGDGADARVLLGEKLRGLGAGRVVGPGGKVEPGEDAATAIAREVAEECGVVLDPAALRAVGRIRYDFPARPAWSQNSTVFVAREWAGTPRSSDEIDPRWFRISDVPYGRMWDDASRWLPAVLAGGTVDAYFRFADDLATVTHWAEADAGGSMRWREYAGSVVGD